MRLAILAIAFALPLTAHAQSPEGEAYRALTICVENAAKRFAVLDDSLRDVADASIASCRSEYQAFEKAARDSERVHDAGSLISGVRSEIVQIALAAIAEARLPD